MDIQFQKVSDFERGTLLSLLRDAYSFDPKFEQHFHSNWQECDSFFYDNIDIADSCCIVTCLEKRAIGFICWDPRHIPEYVELGHNCIVSEYKGFKLGKRQLQEAVSRIKKNVKKITVTTNEALYSAQRNYESLGFIEVGRRGNDSETKFSGDYIDYEMICS